MIRTHAEFLQVAFKAYDNPKIVSVADFEADLKRFGYMNTMLARYLSDSDDCKLRAAVNHIVIILNSFGIDASIRLIRFKAYEENINSLETILYFLKIVPLVDHLNFELLNKLESL